MSQEAQASERRVYYPELDNSKVVIIDPNHKSKNGFTLVELSIVLVIIGLLVGGVLVGSDLIESAKLRAQVSQFQQFDQATNTFKLKYNCLPGDCINFTDFFSSFSPGWSFGEGSNPVATGGGNGLLTEYDNGACCNNTGYPYEIRPEPGWFFMMLFTAGLTNCCNPVGSSWQVNTIGVTFPQDKMNGFGIVPATMLGKNGYFWGMTNNTNNTANSNNYFVISPNTKGVLTPAQAQAFDSKIDDGKATTGNVFSAAVYGGDNKVHPVIGRYDTNCLTAELAYDISNTSNACSLWVKMQ